MLSCSIWFSAPSFWMSSGLERRCVGRVYGVDGAVHGTIRTLHTLFHEEDARLNNPQVCITCGLFNDPLSTSTSIAWISMLLISDLCRHTNGSLTVRVYHSIPQYTTVYHRLAFRVTHERQYQQNNLHSL